MSNTPSYTGVYDISPIFRGDSVTSFSVTIERNTVAVPILSARAHVRTPLGALVFLWPVSVSGNVVTMAPINEADTKRWPVGTLHYDLEVTYATGHVRTYLEGTIKVKADRTY